MLYLRCAPKWCCVTLRHNDAMLASKKNGGMKPRSYQTLMGHVDLMCDYLDGDLTVAKERFQVPFLVDTVIKTIFETRFVKDKNIPNSFFPL